MRVRTTDAYAKNRLAPARVVFCPTEKIVRGPRFLEPSNVMLCSLQASLDYCPIPLHRWNLPASEEARGPCQLVKAICPVDLINGKPNNALVEV
jgi:hypothetical protein